MQQISCPSEAYLAPANRNRPKSGEVCSAQANSSFTKEFTFDTALITCDFFEDTLRCSIPPDPLD